MVTDGGRRTRKKERTRAAIAAAALALFVDRGFDDVTMTEVAEAADVARGTLFAYFPTKESLVLGGPDDDDPAQIVADRTAGTPVVDALHRYYRAFGVAAQAGLATPPASDGLLAALRVIEGSPSLQARANQINSEQFAALAEVLVDEGEAELDAAVMAGMICATVLALKTTFSRQLGAGVAPHAAAARLPDDVDAAFSRLRRGLGDR